MAGVQGSSGGKRPGAGRKPGAGWKGPRPKQLSTLARATTIGIMSDGRDPLLGVLEIAEDRARDDDTRLKAYAIVMPYCRPRLSMVVTADASPKDGQPSVSQEQLMDRVVRMLDRLAPPRPIEALVIEAEPTEIAVAEPDPEL